VDTVDIDEEERGVRLGDNKKMEATLAKIALTILTAGIEEALQEPAVVQGVQLEINGTVSTFEEHGDMETHLSLTKKLGYKPTLELLLKCLGARVRSAKFKKTYKVWNCVGGVLIMPAAMTPEVSNDLVSRIAMLSPDVMPLEDLLKAPAADMEEDASAELQTENFDKRNAEQISKAGGGSV
jgi:hypothetical protein